MPKHEFGILPYAPKPDEFFYDYTPEKYHTISVDDNYILPRLRAMRELDFYWFSTSRMEKGLNYYGITLIPPSSIDNLLFIIGQNRWSIELRTLLQQAKQEQHFIIHFGI